jgi:hypothetical protein
LNSENESNLLSNKNHLRSPLRSIFMKFK